MIMKIHNIINQLNISNDYIIRPKKTPCISYHFFNDSPYLFGDGVIKTNGKSVQVDYWNTHSDNEKTLKKLEKLMIQNGFKLSHRLPTSYEDKVRLYHEGLVFNYYSKEEENESI